MTENTLRLARDLRHLLHTHPELSNQEVWTKQTLMAFLKEHTALEVVDRGLWFYAVHRGGPEGKKLAFRADMDALPIVPQVWSRRPLCHPGRLRHGGRSPGL